MNKYKIILFCILMFLCINIVRAELTDDILGYYNMDEITGNAIDSIKTNTLIQNGSGSVGNNTGIFIGSRGSYSDNDFFINNNILLNYSDSYTVNFWWKKNTSDATGRSLFSSIYSSSQFWFTIYYDASSLRFESFKNGGTYKSATYSPVIPANTWIMVTATWNGSNKNLSLYVNGTFISSSIGTDSNVGLPTGIYVGRNSAAGAFSDEDLIDDLVIYNRTLLSSELKTIYDNGTIGNSFFNMINPIKLKSQTITNTYWNTPTINLTWNVTGANNATLKLYKNKIVNQTLFYQPTNYHIIYITNNYLIGDNISYELYFQNNTYNFSSNSSNIQILPPLLNYINIVNTSTIYKQNLICNYSVNNSDIVIIDWFNNENIFISNSIYLNISDYNSSLLNNNLSCRINNTVQSQNYTNYVFSNKIIIGQNITFAAKRLTDNFIITNFSICYTAGCFNTTTNNITIWNYNVSETYYFYNENYQNVNITLTTNISNQSYTFTPYDAQSIQFYFYNQNYIKIDNVSIRFYSLGFNISYNYSTINGSLYVSLIYPDTYQILSSSTGYATNQIFLTIDYNSYNTKNIYLINTSSAILVTYTVLFSSGDAAKNYDVKILKYNTDTLTWEYIQECRTNDLGNCQMYVIEPDFYRYSIFDSNGVSVFNSPNEFVSYSTRDPFIVQKTNNYLQESQYCQYLKSKSQSPVIYTTVGSNQTYNFSLAANWNIASINSICMKLTKNTKYTYYTTEQEIFDDCLYYSINNQVYQNNIILSKDLYTETIYANVSGIYCQINQGTIDLRDTVKDSTNIIFVLIGSIFMMCVGIFLHSIEISLLLEIIWIIICCVIGFLPFTYATIFGLVFIVIMVIMFLRKG